MMKTKRAMFLASLPVLALGIMMVPGTACDGADALCCDADDFQVGGSVSLEAAGSAQAQASLQAIADIAGIANVMVEDLTGLCRNVAVDLGADAAKQAELDAIENKNERAEKWCALAIEKIGEFKAGATFKLEFKAPACEASFSAQADCNAKCSVDANCDVKATPPECKGGKLEVSCEGSCDVSADAPKISCEGKCAAECSGSCTASAGVDCNGKCDGTCEAKAGVGDGIDAQGNCKGTCKGTCTGEIKGKCEGECKGECTGKCEASPGSVKVKCDGKCEGKAEPLECKGGKLEGGCQVDADCNANCNASVKAKASCSPPELVFNISGGAEANIAKLKATLQANFTTLGTIKAKLAAVGDISGQLTGSAKGLVDIKVACIPAVLKAAESAGKDLSTSVQLSANLVASVQ